MINNQRNIYFFINNMINAMFDYINTSWTTLLFIETTECIVPFFLDHIILNRNTILLNQKNCYDND